MKSKNVVQKKKMKSQILVQKKTKKKVKRYTLPDLILQQEVVADLADLTWRLLVLISKGRLKVFLQYILRVAPLVSAF